MFSIRGAVFPPLCYNLVVHLNCSKIAVVLIPESCHPVCVLNNSFTDLLTGCSWPSHGPVHLLV